MNEQEARKQLEKLLKRHYAEQPNYQDRLIATNGKHGYIEHSLEKILMAGGGKWDEGIAAEQLQSLEADLGK